SRRGTTWSATELAHTAQRHGAALYTPRDHASWRPPLVFAGQCGDRHLSRSNGQDMRDMWILALKAPWISPERRLGSARGRSIGRPRASPGTTWGCLP